MVGSSYVIVSAAKCAKTCVSGNSVEYGVGLWNHCLSGMTTMVVALWSCCAANRAQCMVC